MDDRLESLTPVRAWWSVAILFLLSTTAWMDRSVIAMVIGPIKASFHIGDFQVSLLVGLSFILFYIGLLAPIGWLADRYSRRLILYIGVTVWSIATVGCGLAGSFGQMMAARMAIGAGEGTVSPIAAATIAGQFGRAQMAGPMSLYSIGASAGTAIGVLIAGAILSVGGASGHFDVPLIGRVLPWQLVFIVIGLPGLVLALLAFALPDTRTAPRARRDTSGSLAFIRANPAAYLLTVGGFVAINIAVTSITTWTPEYLRRSFAQNPKQIGAIMAGVSLGAPLLCQLFIGFVVNRLVKRGMRDAPLKVMRWLLLAALPVGAALAFASSPLAYAALMFVSLALIFPSNPLSISAVQMIAPDGVRSGLAAIHLAILGVVGLGLGSSVVALLSQFVVGEDRLGLAMAIAVTGSVTLALVLLNLANRPFVQLAGVPRQDDPDTAAYIRQPVTS